MSAIAQEYQISDVGLRKICRRMNIPLPDFGYWQKVKYHKKVRKKLLPVTNYNDEYIELMIRDLGGKSCQSEHLIPV